MSGSPVAGLADFGNKSITDPSQDTPGTIIPSIASWDISGHIPIKCDCTGEHGNRYYSAKSSLPPTSTDGDKTYYKINDYISAAIQIRITGNDNQYHYVPFTNLTDKTNVSRDDCGAGSTGTTTTGEDGKVDIKIERAIIGAAFFNNIHISDLYVNKASSAPLQTPYLQVFLSGSISFH